MNPAAFLGAGSTAVWTAGLMGASLGGTLWSTFHKENKAAEGSVQRFDKAMNTMSTASIIPIIYGERLVQGNQTYHKPNGDLNMLRKHVVLCEGGIEGVVSVMAEGIPIPTTQQAPGTVFLIQNTKYSDATVSVRGCVMYLKSTAGSKTIKLGGSANYSDSTYSTFNVNISSLVTYINQLGDGWAAYPYATTNKEPKDIHNISEVSCYKSYISCQTDSATGSTTFSFHDGDLPDTYKETGSYSGCAWLDMNLAVSSELGGNPNIDVILRGEKVYDTRTKIKAYSTNPSMCLRDFLTNSVYGVGWNGDIDEDSFKECADWCDASVSYVDANGATQTCKRYELNIILDSQDDAIDQISKILSCCAGYLTVYKGTIAMHIEKATPVSYSFTEKVMVSGSFSTSQIGLDESYNKYEISFIDPLNNWKSSKAIVENTADQKERGRLIEKSIDLEGVQSQHQVLRLGRFYRDLVSVCPTYCQFTTAAQAMHLKPGDVVNVSYYNVFKDKPFRIIEMKEENGGKITLKCREYNESIYSDELGARIQVYNYVTIDNPYTGSVPDILNLKTSQEYYRNKDGTVISNLNLTYDLPAYSYFGKIKIYASIDGADYQLLLTTYDNKATLQNVRTLCKYQLKVVMENTIGRVSSGAVLDNIYITGKDAPPADVLNLIASKMTSDKTMVVLGWDAVTDVDLRGYRIRINNSTVTPTPISDTSYQYRITSSGTYNFSVVAVDNSGNESTNPAVTTIGMTLEPIVPTGFKVEQSSSDRSILKMSWDTINSVDIAGYEVRYGDNWDTGTVMVAQFKANSISVRAPAEGYFVFHLRALSTQGYYSQGDAVFTLQIYLTPSSVTNLKVEQLKDDRSKAVVSWIASPGNDISCYEVKYGDSWDTGIDINSTKETQTSWSPPGSGTYNIMVRAVTVAGYYSPIANARITITIEAYDVTGFKATQSKTDKTRIMLSWDAPYDPDISYYIIKEGMSWSNSDVVTERATGLFFDTIISDESDKLWWIKAVNRGGHESQFPVSAEGIFNLNPTPVSVMRAFQSSADRSGLSIQWSEVPDGDLLGYVVKIGYSWESAEALPLTKELYTTYKLNNTGNVKIMIKTVNTAGFYSDEYSITYYANCEPTNATNLISYQNGETVELYWTKSIDDDVVAYEIREGASFDQGSLVASGVTISQYVAKVDMERDYQYHVKAINRSGFYSLRAVSTKITVTNLPVKNIIEVFNEIAIMNGISQNTEIGASLINFSNIGGRFSDYKTTRFSDVGGKSVLKLKNNNAIVNWNLGQSNANIHTYNAASGGLCSLDGTGAVTYSQTSQDGFWIPFNRLTVGKTYVVEFSLKNSDASNVTIGMLNNIKNWTTPSDTIATTKGYTTYYREYTVPNSVDYSGYLIGWDNANTRNMQMSYFRIYQKGVVANYAASGTYSCQPIDVGSLITANITANFVSTVLLKGTGSAVLQMRISQDGTNWLPWQEFKPVQYTFRCVQFAVLLGTSDPTKTPEVNQLTVYIDVPDTDIAKTVQIAAGGTTVNYGHTFYTMPVVTPTGIGEGVHAVLVSKNLTSCVIKIKNESNTDVGGQADIRIKGY